MKKPLIKVDGVTYKAIDDTCALCDNKCISMFTDERRRRGVPYCTEHESEAFRIVCDNMITTNRDDDKYFSSF